MVLQRDTKIGLTFGQILGLITVMGSIIISWVSINVKIAQAEIRIDQLEIGRQTNARNIEVIRLENREDHNRILEKLDELIKTKLDK